MNNLGFETPWALTGLLLTLLPWFRNSMPFRPYPWLVLIPADSLSQILTILIRLLATVTIAVAVLGLSGIYLQAQKIERIGNGAHIVLLLDRSNSMDQSFAGKTPIGQEQSKAAAARRLLKEFIDHRPHDRIGIAAYSTAPLMVMPLTENKVALHAAIDATAAPALAYTNISKGLGLALTYFDQQPMLGSRLVLLVSDGAAVIDPDSEAALRTLFKQQQVRLYWLFLRTDNNPGIFSEPEQPGDDNAQAMPERYLHLFFNSLAIPYQAYEAENPAAMQKAIADINQLEQLPLHYQELQPKQDLSTECYRFLAGLIGIWLIVKYCEVRK
ncbi:VWA domain-containing protein [Methylomonas paludis]|uniref:VWA domain-containing protein n=1 Tax=Methylomonas paludis TaxID=1173101 RepID=A0A975R9F7_9GAMM|nr:vWA domain-containing protein [Methylomonas paludis]QWF70146.1 VWA domain-containing protein [Methylomonas paludis]